MEALIFIGIPGSGKSSLYKERFFTTHVRISLDLPRTRSRELRFLETCLSTRQRFVVDNTNVTRADRVRYIEAARSAGFTVAGYYFESRIEDCLRRNSERSGRERVPDVAILSTANRLERPALQEGFDRLFFVRWKSNQQVVEEWRDDL